MLTIFGVIVVLWVFGWSAFSAVSAAAGWWQERPVRRAAHRRRVLENRAAHGDRAAAEQLGWWVRGTD